MPSIYQYNNERIHTALKMAPDAFARHTMVLSSYVETLS